MEKALLIIDMPFACLDCPVYDPYHRICSATREKLGDNRFDVKGNSCPLKKMPEKIQAEQLGYEDRMLAEGWNACIEGLK